MVVSMRPMANQMAQCRWPRRGITLLEVTVAVGMLAVLLATSVQMLHVFTIQHQAAERHAVALQAVQAIAEQAANIRWDELTSQSAGQLTLPPIAASRLPAARLSLTVENEVEPVVAKRIMITLTWNAPNGRQARPVRLTCWAYAEN
jgi:type II secretory pathway pseudopilin PulG